MEEEIVNEETILDLSGFYKYNGQKTRVDGSVIIQPDGSFEGEVYDYNSRSPAHKIMGHIVDEGYIAKMTFLKFPQDAGLANLLYKLETPITGLKPFSFKGEFNIVREFKGRWEALPYKIKYNSDYDLFMAQIDLSVIGIGDEAGITLSG